MTNPLDWLLAPITQKFGPTSEPLDGPYNGYPHFNKGWDFGVVNAPIGSNVTGIVTSASSDPNNPNGWGKQVVVKDDNGFLHHFSHLSSVNVGAGQMVNIGTVLGVSGNTGNSTGPHLSYDVQDPTGKFVDPSRFLAGSAAGVPASGGGSSGGGGFDIPIGFPDIPNPLDSLSGIPGALKSGFDTVAAPFQKLAEVAIWLLNPQHWFKLFFILAGTGMVAMGLYVYVRGTSGIESDIQTAGKVAAVGA